MLVLNVFVCFMIAWWQSDGTDVCISACVRLYLVILGGFLGVCLPIPFDVLSGMWNSIPGQYCKNLS